MNPRSCLHPSNSAIDRESLQVIPGFDKEYTPACVWYPGKGGCPERIASGSTCVSTTPWCQPGATLTQRRPTDGTAPISWMAPRDTSMIAMDSFREITPTVDPLSLHPVCTPHLPPSP